MSSFFSRLSYSIGNEDWSTEEEGLKIEPSNRVLCITASGDRPLHILQHPCQEVVAVDANPVQNYLLDLKVAAMKKLDNPNYLAFMGISACSKRLHTLNLLNPHLSSLSAHYWRKHAKMVNKGILYQGDMENWVRRLTYLLRKWRKHEIQTLFSCQNLEQQKEFLEKGWNHKFWKRLFKIVLTPWLSRYLYIKDPGLYAHFDSSVSPGEVLYDRFMRFLHDHLAKENLLLSMVLLGEIHHEALPPYLTTQGIDLIRPRLDRLNVVTQDVISYLRSAPENHFDRFSMSDVASYLSYDSFVSLLNVIVHSAKPGARFCLRQFLSNHKIPNHLKHHFCQEPELERKLERKDRACVYHFNVGVIKK